MYAYGRNNPLLYTDPNGETYRVCQAGFEGQDENCGEISDEQFAKFRKTQSLRFVGGNKGSIYSGNTLLGSFRQTDVDLPMEVSLALHAAGVTADREFKNAVRDVAIGVATGVVAGAVVGGIAKGLESAPRLLPFKDSDLIRRVSQALDRVAQGAKQFNRDGIVFQNREGLLPSKGPGYYREFTVQPPAGASGRGAERLVVGQGGEVYYTPNHYGSFVRIQ